MTDDIKELQNKSDMQIMELLILKRGWDYYDVSGKYWSADNFDKKEFEKEWLEMNELKEDGLSDETLKFPSYREVDKFVHRGENYVYGIVKKSKQGLRKSSFAMKSREGGTCY